MATSDPDLYMFHLSERFHDPSSEYETHLFPVPLALSLCLLITSCQKSATEPTEAVASIRFTAPTLIDFKNWRGQVESVPMPGSLAPGSLFPKVEITRTGAIFTLKSDGEVIEIPASNVACWKPQ